MHLTASFHAPQSVDDKRALIERDEKNLEVAVRELAEFRACEEDLLQTRLRNLREEFNSRATDLERQYALQAERLEQQYNEQARLVAQECELAVQRKGELLMTTLATNRVGEEKSHPPVTWDTPPFEPRRTGLALESERMDRERGGPDSTAAETPAILRGGVSMFGGPLGESPVSEQPVLSSSDVFSPSHPSLPSAIKKSSREGRAGTGTVQWKDRDARRDEDEQQTLRLVKRWIGGACIPRQRGMMSLDRTETPSNITQMASPNTHDTTQRSRSSPRGSPSFSGSLANTRNNSTHSLPKSTPRNRLVPTPSQRLRVMDLLTDSPSQSDSDY